MTADHTNVPPARDDRRPLADRVKDLDGFVPELRVRLDRGEYANLGPVDLGELSPLGDPENALRIMLADWDHFENLTTEQRDDYSVAARRLNVLADLHAFRQRLDGRADTPPHP
jgi:hypothetical protein